MLIKIGNISFFCNNYQRNCAIFQGEGLHNYEDKVK